MFVLILSLCFTSGSYHFKQISPVYLESETHGGEDIPVYARGPMSHLFTGTNEQNFLPHAMAYASCVGQNQEHCQRQPTSNSNTNSMNWLVIWVYFARALNYVNV